MPAPISPHELLDELDVQPELVEAVGVVGRDDDSANLLLDRRQPSPALLTLFRANRPPCPLLDVMHIPVPADDLASYLPPVHRRGDPNNRDQDGDHRNEHDEHSFDERRDPEGKMASKKGGSTSQVALGIFTEGEADVLGRRELSRPLEELPGTLANARVPLPSGPTAGFRPRRSARRLAGTSARTNTQSGS